MKNVLGDPKAIIILLAPALLVYTIASLVPVVWSVVYSLYDGDTISGLEFVGLANFERLFRDPKVWNATLFTLKYAIVVTIGQVVIGYMLSLFYVFALRRGGAFVRTVVFFPVVLPTVAVGLMFQGLFAIQPADGLVNSLITALGGESVDWLGTGSSAFLVLAIMDIWRAMGFYGVLLYAGLLDIPEELIESARIDGATSIKLLRYIIFPLSLPVLLSAAIFAFNGTLKVFDSVVALTRGGPNDATTPLTVYMFNTAFTYGEYGYGSTIAILLTVICLIVTVVIFRSTRRDVTQG